MDIFKIIFNCLKYKNYATDRVINTLYTLVFNTDLKVNGSMFLF